MGIIDENLAKRAKENSSFSDYKKGSATSGYNQMVEEARAKIEKAKERVSEEGKQRLDKLLERYKANMACWINKHNANGASHVSSMIAGPANYNMRKHEKWMQKEGKLWEEYDRIKDIDSQIYKIINGDKIISSDDPKALEKLKLKLKKAQKEHEEYKKHNKAARKEGKGILPAYVLSNSNANIRNIKKRIEKLERLEEAKKIEPKKETVINGIKIVDNLEVNRLQIVFDYKPSVDIRNMLKRYGFRWSPKNNAWQRFRSTEAIRIAKKIAVEV